MKIFFWVLQIILWTADAYSYEGVIVYLHGMGKNPLRNEEKVIGKLRTLAHSRGFLLLAPQAPKNCSYLNPPRPEFKCWDQVNFQNDLEYIKEKVSEAQKISDKGKKNVMLIGFSNGGYFLGGALQRNLIKNVSKVGIISGGSVGIKIPEDQSNFPEVFIENATKDKWNKDWVEKLFKILSSSKVSSKVKYRIVDREHQPTLDEVEGYLIWMLN